MKKKNWLKAGTNLLTAILMLITVSCSKTSSDLPTNPGADNVKFLGGTYIVPQEDQETYNKITSEIAKKYPLSKSALLGKLRSGATVSSVNPSEAQIIATMKEMGTKYGVPFEIIYAIGKAESGLLQFYSDGRPVISPDNGIGIMQVTPWAVGIPFDEESLKWDYRYNIEAGVQVILSKYQYTSGRNPIGDNNSKVLENWYLAIWAYNGYSYMNNPNEYIYGARQWCNDYMCWTRAEAYQTKILGYIKNKFGITVTPIPNSQLPGYGSRPGIPYSGQSFSTPTPYHFTGNSASVAGNNSDTPALAMNSDGRLEAFMRGSDGRIYHSWQNSANGSWSNWYPMGSAVAGNPNPAYQQNGSIVVFTRGINNDVVWIKQSENWSTWHSLGGITYYDPAVNSNEDGRLEFFVTGTTGNIYKKYQATVNGRFIDGWDNIGGNSDRAPSVGNNQDGRLEVFVRFSDGRNARKYQTNPNGGWISNWDTNPAGYITDKPVIVKHSNGCLYVFVRGTNNVVYYMHQLAPNSSWSGWKQLGDFSANSQPCVGINTNGSLMVFAVGTDNALYSNRMTDGNWSGWSSHGGICTSTPAIAKYQDGRLAVIIRGNNGKMYIRVQKNAGSIYWENWRVLGDDVARF